MKCWSRIGARNTLRTAMFRERERLGAHHVVTGVENFCQASENDIQQQQHENIGNAWKYVYNLKQHEIELRS